MVSFGKSGGSSQQSYVWQPQQEYLEKLYSEAGGMFDELYPDTVGAADVFSKIQQPFLNKAMRGISDTSYLDKIKSGTNLGMSGFGDILSGNSPGMETMTGVMNPMQNPYLESTISDMYGGISRNLEENILPMQRSEESIMGQYGQPRGEIAEGLAKAEAIRTGGEMERGMRSGAFETGQDRALTSALGYTDAITGAAQGYTGTGMTAEQLAAQKAGMVPDIAMSRYNLGMTPYTMPWDVLSQYQQSIGGPAILGSGSSGSGFNFGIG